MSSLDILDHKTTVAHLLSCKETEDVFEAFREEVLSYYSRPVNSLTELKKRDLKQSIGTTWENFCADWLRSKRGSNGEVIYDSVWTLREWNEYSRNNSLEEMTLRKQDVGIDLIAHSQNGYHAVQCKWKKAGKVTWTQLSTFIGLVSRTGPWISHIIMTSGSGVIWKVARTSKDKTIARSTFDKTTREEWQSISGVSSEGHKLSDGGNPTKDEMREARLKKFAPSV